MSNPLKKTMVFLGLAEEDVDDASTTDAPGAPVAQSAPAKSTAQAQEKPAHRAPVAPLRRVTPVRQPAAQAMSEILTVHPTEYRDARAIAENFREGVPVILNLSRMNDDEAKRLIDFASGLTLGLHGRIERVTSKVFLLTPEHIEVGSDEPVRDESGSFFVGSDA